MKQLLSPALALLLLAQCKKADADPESALPAETQTGANTFGCLFNGQPWTPQGYNGSSNYSVVYDAKLNGGVFDLRTYRYPQPGNANNQQYIILYANQVSKAGIYSFQTTNQTSASLEDRLTGCYWDSRDNATTYRRGHLTITCLDLTAGVIAGTFEFTLYKPGCDSVRVTQGRFDKKL